MSVTAPISQPPGDRSTAAPVPAYPNLMPDFDRLNDSPSWFQARAKAAWDESQSLPMPGPKDEAWRYSSSKKLALDALNPAAEPSEADQKLAIEKSRGLEKTSAKLVFVND